MSAVENSPPVILAIETSGRSASISLLHGDNIDTRHLDETGRRHARTLVPELKRLLDEHGLAPYECSCVGVSVGPGSFTGLRVGIAAAKTLAWAVGKPLVGVGTLEVIARQALREYARISVVMNAERNQIYVADAAVSDDDGWPTITLSPTRIIDCNECCGALPHSVPLCGPLPKKMRDQLEGSFEILPESLGQPSAETVARIAARRFLNGEVQNAFALVPDYGRLSAAEEKALGAAEEKALERN